MSDKHPPATREDHDQFCENERWKLVHGAAGQPVKHHRTYELALWDGRILRTRISKPVDQTDYATSMRSHILRSQLNVTADAFWSCVNSTVLPDRGSPKTPGAKNAVPLFLVEALREHGVDDDAILALDAAGAAALLASKYHEEQSARSGDAPNGVCARLKADRR